MRRRSTIAAALALSVLLGAVAAARIDAGEEARRPSWPFRVKGAVSGLYPGRVKPLKVRVRNPYRFPIRLVRITSEVSTERAGCPNGTVKVKPWRGDRRIAAGNTRRVRLQVRMRRGAPDACAGARYRLRYTARSRVVA